MVIIKAAVLLHASVVEHDNSADRPLSLLWKKLAEDAPHGKRRGQAVAVVTPNIHLKITTLYYRYIILVNDKDKVGFPSFSCYELFNKRMYLRHFSLLISYGVSLSHEYLQQKSHKHPWYYT